jgi:prepilin-type N-terminal cleavage/methylation domain-containing protein
LKYPSLSQNGFTLIEIVVALCIVAILTVIAVPGFRKATEDFRLNTTLEDTVDILKACRNYYLIFNEFPPDTSEDISDKLRPFVSSHLIKASTWSRRPLGQTAYAYDLDSFLDLSYKPHSMGISLRGIKPNTADWNKCYNKFKSVLGEKYIADFSLHDRMFCMLPECPGSTNPNSDEQWDNRYY